MGKRSLGARLARGLRPAVLGPLRFAVDSGHWRSSMLCQSVDRRGRPLPWITYPAMEFLESFDWNGVDVVEWGAGNSTLWWIEHGARVFSIEHDPHWAAEVRRRLDGHPSASLQCHTDAADYARAALGRPCELAVIDGLARYRCAEVAVQVAAPTGAIVLDNAEQSWAETGQSGFPILDLMRGMGWRRLDFHGFAPSVARPHVTSVFIRPECRLFERQRPPRMRPGIIPG